MLIPLGNTFIVPAEGAPSPATAYKGTQGKIYEERISTSGAVVGTRNDWQIETSSVDNTIFVLGGVGDNWSWIDRDGTGHRLAPDWNYQPVFRDAAGTVWAVRYTPTRDLLLEFGDGDAVSGVDYGGERIFQAVPACDGAIWLLVKPNTLVRMAGGSKVQVAHLTYDPTANNLALIPAADGSVWVVVHRPTGDFTGYTDVTRYSASGAVGKTTVITEDEPIHAVVGPDGALWSMSFGGLYRIGLDGDLHVYQLGKQDQPAYPAHSTLTFGPAGRLWYVCAAREICSLAFTNG